MQPVDPEHAGEQSLPDQCAQEFTERPHPCPFTDSIIEALRLLIPQHVTPEKAIHDPFGGGGVPLGRLCDDIGYRFAGTDLEPWRDGDPRVALGDSTLAESYPTWPFVVVTSPTYNNGVNDHFKPKDTSTRLTYRVAAGRELHENNTGRYSGRGSKRGEESYWRLTREVVKHWPDTCLVNVKDSVRAGQTYPLVPLWHDLLMEHGYEVRHEWVYCPGWRMGRNGQERSDAEAILIAKRSATPDRVGSETREGTSDSSVLPEQER